MASGSGFEGDVGYVAAEMRKIAASSRDIARNIEKTSTVFVNFEKAANRAESKMADIGRRMERLNELGDKGGFEKLRKSLRGLAAERGAFKMLDSLDKGISKIASSIAKLGTGIIAETFDFLIGSIKRVYELQERWTRAIGGFNMRIGGMTSGLKQAQRAATAWSGTIRGLTNGDINEGIQMFEEFTMAMDRVVAKGDAFSKFGLQLARGFNLGGDGAGKLASTFEDMGASATEAISTMSELVDAANLVGIPVNQLAADVTEANTYMARFGKDGAKGFVTAAAYARRFAISMRELQSATERFDLFDDAATAASKLNSTFGTLVNSVDLMLMDDPAQRIEYLRQQFLAQGKTFDTLSVKERRYAAETMGVNDQALAALLNFKDANVSYMDITAKQREKEASDQQAKRRMEIQLRKTAQTMYAFGSAFDRITLAIAKAIKPLLEVLGLAKSGGKDFKSFGQVMESVTQTIIHFFESLATNDKWQSFMRKLAGGMREMAHAVSNFIMSGRAAKWAGELADAMSKVYDYGRKAFLFMIDSGKRLEPVLRFVVNHIKEIAIAWAAWQGVKMAGGVAQNIKSASQLIPRWRDSRVGTGTHIRDVATRVSGASSGGIDWATATGDPFSESFSALGPYQARRAARMQRIGGGLKLGGAAAIAAGLGTAASGGSLGESVGSGVGAGAGTALGMIIGGPVGAALGGAIGEFAGRRLGGVISSLFGSGQSPLEKARKDLQTATDSLSRNQKNQSDIIELANSRQMARDAKRAALDSAIIEIEKRSHKSKGTVNRLTESEARNIRDRAEEMIRLGVGVRENKSVISSLAEGTKLTDSQIRRLRESTEIYNDKLSALRETTQRELAIKMAELEAGQLAQKKAVIEDQLKQSQIEVDREKAMLADIKSGASTAPSVSNLDEAFVKWAEKGGGGASLGIARTEMYHKYGYNNKYSTEELIANLSKDQRKALEKDFAIAQQREKINRGDQDLLKKQRELVDLTANFEHQKFLIFARGAIMSDARYAEYRTANAGKNEKDLFKGFLEANADEFRGLYGNENYGQLLGGRVAMASGGIVRRPTRALIGESGPEAIIPLRALARGGKLSRSLGIKGAANLAGGGAGTQMHVVTSQVILDGVAVGRAVTRVALSSPEA